MASTTGDPGTIHTVHTDKSHTCWSLLRVASTTSGIQASTCAALCSRHPLRAPVHLLLPPPQLLLQEIVLRHQLLLAVLRALVQVGRHLRPGAGGGEQVIVVGRSTGAEHGFRATSTPQPSSTSST